ncbi:GNAT family N-acetyltransferase [Amycolatopsis bartoniae]|uniref:N-acetyltransferase domain-containing protein n=2 Tax=Amycolatopsis bartoniae TaxID=941986 RepID=A0A8H9IW12_9PSEU|nr:GNAT family N-acetyltransferase [Amycolatopsis bartoniae]GHF50758.1 hypothetical protein GCM10017566_24850 [Amycolatopsis bartoniae]
MFGHSAAGHTTGADWIAGQLQLQQDNATVTRHFAWAVVRSESDTVIGWTTLANINFYDGGEVEVVIDPAHRCHGYGGLVLTEVIRWAFEELVPTFTIDPHGAWTSDPHADQDPAGRPVDQPRPAANRSASVRPDHDAGVSHGEVHGCPPLLPGNGRCGVNR